MLNGTFKSGFEERGLVTPFTFSFFLPDAVSFETAVFIPERSPLSWSPKLPPPETPSCSAPSPFVVLFVSAVGRFELSSSSLF